MLFVDRPRSRVQFVILVVRVLQFRRFLSLLGLAWRVECFAVGGAAPVARGDAAAVRRRACGARAAPLRRVGVRARTTQATQRRARDAVGSRSARPRGCGRGWQGFSVRDRQVGWQAVGRVKAAKGPESSIADGPPERALFTVVPTQAAGAGAERPKGGWLQELPAQERALVARPRCWAQGPQDRDSRPAGPRLRARIEARLVGGLDLMKKGVEAGLRQLAELRRGRRRPCIVAVQKLEAVC